MRISRSGLELLAEFEGFSAIPYADSGGAMTIGYGHLILPGERWDEPLSKDEASWLLLGDAMFAEYAVNELATMPLTQNQFDALICLVFNIGASAFKRSTLLRMLHRREYSLAAMQFGVWVYDNGIKVAGLQNRRRKEKKLFLTT